MPLPPEQTQALDAHISADRETLIELQRLLVGTPALGPDNGGTGEHAKAAAVAKWCEEHGITTDARPMQWHYAPDQRAQDGTRPNLSVVIPGHDTSRTLWIIGHLDVVPVGDPALWDADPFALRVEGDLMYGRGVEDNHQAIIDGLLLARALVAKNITPPVNLGLQFVADEETGSTYGLKWLVKNRPELFGKDDLFLVPDFGTEDGSEIEVAEKSMLWLKVTVLGAQCHASIPHKGNNSLVAAADFILRIAHLTEEYDATDKLFDPPVSTIEPTKKEANVENVNTVPGRDVFCVDCRILPQYPIDGVLNRIKELGREVEALRGVTMEYEVIQKEQAAEPTPQDAPVVTALAGAVQAVYGVTARPVGIGGGTVAAVLRREGLHAAVWGSLMHNAHQPNEHASIDKTVGDARVMAHMLATL